MKILFCTQYFDTATVGPAVLTEMLRTIGNTSEHEIRFLTPDTSKNATNIYKLDIQIPKAFLPFDFLFYNWAYYRHIKYISKEYQPDVILFGNCLLGYLPSCVMRKNFIFLGFVNDAFFVNAIRFSFSKQYFYRYFLKKMQYFSFLSYQKIIACSFFLKHTISAFYPKVSSKTTVLYQGVDLEKAVFRERKIPSFNTTKHVKIIFVKKLIHIGGLDILLESLSQLADYQFFVTIIGDNVRFERDINQLMESYPNIEFSILGLIKKEDVYQQLYTHDILCIPSRQEALGIANIEGLACGIPVVSVKTGGIVEVLDDGNNGWLVEPNDIVSLATALKACIEAPPSVFLEKITNGRRFVEKHFDNKKLAWQLLDICTNT